ncbi:MAG TPA: universal stress protein [Parafilimonas sp.]|nr:universal stress protein [Parafilimonas sp.]
MKKIIAAFDGLKYCNSTADYAINIAKQSHAHLVGIFLDDMIYHSYRFTDVIVNGEVSEKKLKDLNEKDRATRKHSINLFKTDCEHASLEFSVHHDKNVALKDLLHESVYADLLVIGKKENFSIYQNKFPSGFMSDVLSDVQCPVMVVPEKYKPLQSIIFLYDGDPSSVYAIKMFCYNLVALRHLPTKVLSVRPLEQSLHLPDNYLMKEFMKRHLPKAEYIVLKGDVEDTSTSYLQQQSEEALVVLGAYQRGRVSRWFKPSMADVLMKSTNLPMFIAHR